MSVIVQRDCARRERMRRGRIGQALSLLVLVFPGHAMGAITRKRHRDWSTRGVNAGEGCVMAGQVIGTGAVARHAEDQLSCLADDPNWWVWAGLRCGRLGEQWREALCHAPVNGEAACFMLNFSSVIVIEDGGMAERGIWGWGS
ncbi:hypothetical protein E2C01_075431 [Portunus trituberculatus]|uniref:Uncharacterized protein n=1 Tax=Portunus trituberculatus TaxID=210409 RepID=A0A5B7IJ52_PORTR|nr:hypothetical protein [Portunus trituberculatus]